MSKSAIEWTDETVVLHPERLNALPMGGAPRRVFVNSMSDLFHDDVPDEFLDQVFAAMAIRPHITFQILTKRAQRMALYFGEDKYKNAGRHGAVLGSVHFQIRKYPAGRDLFNWPLENVWLGVSVENQKSADERITWLLNTPAVVRFLSVEPMLGPVDLSGWLSHKAFTFTHGAQWVIVGGESGAGARPMHPDWAREIRDQCQAAGVPFFFKQWGAWFPTHEFGKRIAPWRESDGRELDGREWNEFPEAPRLG